MPQKTLIEKITTGIGSVPSLIIHTCLFASSFLLAVFGLAPWDTMLLVLTTILSLEAIYLAIFIQMSVNRHAVELAEVSEDVEDIQEDIQEISQDVDEIQKDVDEIQEDVGEISHDVDEIQKDVDEIQEDVEEINEDETEEEQNDREQKVVIEQLTQDVRRLLADLEHLKKK